jgi:uncharacterized membrane protein
MEAHRHHPRNAALRTAPLTEKMSASLDLDAMIAPTFRTALAQAAKGAGMYIIEGEAAPGKEKC